MFLGKDKQKDKEKMMFKEQMFPDREKGEERIKIKKRRRKNNPR